MTSGSPTRMAAWLESAWLARYLERQLDGEELAWFEGYLLDKPELLEMVEADNALRDAIARMPRAAQSSAEAISPTTTDRRDARPRLPSAAFAAAAALVVGLGAGWWSGRKDFAANDVIASPQRIVYDTLRGSEMPASFPLNNMASPYILVEVALPPDATRIQLEIGAIKVDDATLSSEGFATFLVRRSVMESVQSARVTYESDAKRRVLDIAFPILKKEKP